MENEPIWYKEAVIYELHVRAFCDSDGDGVGDFRGLASKLDYLQDLGFTAIWLLPFYPSPLKDDGYDIADYTSVHPSYGTLSDFKYFLKEAHRRGLKVITELVLNHTSDQHEWFRRARGAPAGSPARDFYVWSKTPDKYHEARVIFKDFESSNWAWDHKAQSYYWHRFYSHQPDLNFDNPKVRKAMLDVVDYWLKMGVDGLRLDAVPYLFEREGTHCENLPETHAFLKELRKHVDRKFKNRMLLAEANQWPEDAVAYFGDGDECHMAFHFPIMPRLFMSLHMEDHFPIIDILQQTPAIPESAQWALFLRNHDELTLEMVTDEERDYMYRMYAHDNQARINLGIRRRLAPLLGNHRRKIELMNSLLFSLPGTPVIYYGDEMGMGDNIYLGDRNGVRTPMQWSADRNAGFSQANPQKLFLPIIIDPEYHFETTNVEAQRSNIHSLLFWMRRLIALRKRYRAFSQGSVEFLPHANRKVLVFVRQYQDERILVVANLSRYVQFVQLDLPQYKGMTPVELFGQVRFPAIGRLPYFLTLGPHAFYWFSLQPVKKAEKLETSPVGRALPRLVLKESWDECLNGKFKADLASLLPGYVKDRRWFGGKAREIKQIEIIEAVPFEADPRTVYLLVIRVDYVDREPERYLLPVSMADAKEGDRLRKEFPQSPIAVVQMDAKNEKTDGVLYDAVYSPSFLSFLFESILRRRQFKGCGGRIEALTARNFKKLLGKDAQALEPRLMKAEQSNSSVIFGDRFVLKFFRRFEEGINPDLEIGLFLSENKNFQGVPAVGGALEYKSGRREPATIGILSSFVANQGDAWRYTLDSLAQYFERVLVHPSIKEPPRVETSALDLSKRDVEPVAAELISPYLETARLLGKRSAEMHVALSEESDNPAFIPENFTPFYQRSLYQSMRNLTDNAFQGLMKRWKTLPQAVQPLAKGVLDQKEEVLRRFQAVSKMKITASRIRTHGDFHLGQVLYTGKDFIIIDFEGEPARSLQERKIKRSPLRDVAGMLRSFHYAAYSSLSERRFGRIGRSEDIPLMEPWALFWNRWVSSAYLKAYLETAIQGPFLPKGDKELEALLNTYVLEKAIYELNYEMNNRPDWVNVPLKGILEILGLKA